MTTPTPTVGSSMEESSGRMPLLFIFYDAKRKNEINKQYWTDDQIKRAHHLVQTVRSLYKNKRKVYLNYRQKFIAIKVQRPTDWERSDPAVLQFGDNVGMRNDIVTTDNGVIYRFRSI